MDEATNRGLNPHFVAGKIIQGIEDDKDEILIAGFKELAAIHLKRFFPRLFSVMIRRTKVV